MFTKSTVASIILVAFAGQAMAEEVSPGQQQLARSIGVAPGVFTLPELARIRDTDEGKRAAVIDYLISQNRFDLVRRSTAPNSGRATMAAAAGVHPDTATMSQIYRLFSAKESGDRAAANLVIDEIAGRGGPKPASHVSPGEAAIAAGLGVDPADYTLAELARMKASLDD